MIRKNIITQLTLFVMRNNIAMIIHITWRRIYANDTNDIR